MNKYSITNLEKCVSWYFLIYDIIDIHLKQNDINLIVKNELKFCNKYIFIKYLKATSTKL